MTHDELATYLESVGFTIETLEAGGPPATASFLVIRDFEVRVGTKAGQKYEIAVQMSTAVPYVLPPAIHVRPHAVTMGSSASQGSPLGPDWQYLSRVLRVTPTPANVVAHLHSIFGEL
ncbi:MAG TPA: hypothetical protein VNF24_00535 [Candidatus Acidoferrales bacterium]|nr:hypothetical protein [Candidatus Acidoferrales bacterium]HVC23600.1 hypothetical protein [Candidatus Dormibacteraeota bacterium]